MKRLIPAAVLFTVILLGASPYALAAETFPARVVGVVDGDTLKESRREGGGAVRGYVRRAEEFKDHAGVGR